MCRFVIGPLSPLKNPARWSSNFTLVYAARSSRKGLSNIATGYKIDIHLVFVMNAAAAAALLDIPCFSSNSTTGEVRQALINSLWPSSQAPGDHVDDFAAYFTFLEGECHINLQDDYAVRTFADLVDILGLVRSNITATMDELRQTVQNTYSKFGTDTQKITASIELVVRLWLMINVRNLMPKDHLVLQTSLPWPDASSLVDVFRQRIGQSHATHSIPRDYFPECLNVCDLRRISGYQTYWTDDLMSHLALDGGVIYLYYHVSVLRRIRKSVQP